MRIVLDTNVLIAALVSDGFCQDLVDHCFRIHVVVLSDFILDELKTKLQDKFRYSTGTADASIEFFSSRSVIVFPRSIPSVSRDPDDDNIIATAIDGNCECIVTGDNDLLSLVKVGDIRILSPRQFVEFES